MPALAHRPCHLLALALIIAANASAFAADAYAGRALTSGLVRHTTPEARERHERYRSGLLARGAFAEFVGMACAALGLVALLASYARREVARRDVPWLLAGSYVLVFLTVV